MSCGFQLSNITFCHADLRVGVGGGVLANATFGEASCPSVSGASGICPMHHMRLNKEFLKRSAFTWSTAACEVLWSPNNSPNKVRVCSNSWTSKNKGGPELHQYAPMVASAACLSRMTAADSPFQQPSFLVTTLPIERILFEDIP